MSMQIKPPKEEESCNKERFGWWVFNTFTGLSAAILWGVELNVIG